MSPQSPSNSSISTDTDQAGKNPAAAFGPNEWLVDEIYQQYLQDPNSVDRAWWDFFADYKPGAGAAAPAGTAAAGGAAPAPRPPPP
ncbi:2-oxoglutarate dehydrogenase E1 subunit family protein, partial [Streptomyces chartreusis]|uniref:2-oxoglutarate dehydrogenase E1 subunit family protein n=1 Tax=Streptomyces chartreusis TaxID=1969 RepID=UPI003644BD46